MKRIIVCILIITMVLTLASFGANKSLVSTEIKTDEDGQKVRVSIFDDGSKEEDYDVDSEYLIKQEDKDGIRYNTYSNDRISTIYISQIEEYREMNKKYGQIIRGLEYKKDDKGKVVVDADGTRYIIKIKLARNAGDGELALDEGQYVKRGKYDHPQLVAIKYLLKTKFKSGLYTQKMKSEDEVTARKKATAESQVAQKAAEQAEKDRIANTVYKIEVDNVLDFIPHFEPGESIDFAKTYKYERADTPGVIFTLGCFKSGAGYWSISESNPNFTIENVRNYRYRTYDDNWKKYVNYYVSDFTYNYLSPFEGLAHLPFDLCVSDDPNEYRCKLHSGGIPQIHIGWNSFFVHCLHGIKDDSGQDLMPDAWGQIISFNPDNIPKTAEEWTRKVRSMPTQYHIQWYTSPKDKETHSSTLERYRRRFEQWDAEGRENDFEIIPLK